MNINIPPDSQDRLFSSFEHLDEAGDGAIWSFRYPPPCMVGDAIHFRFGGKLVAMAHVHSIRPPGELDGVAHHGRRVLTGHKVVWLWSSFQDLRDRPVLVAAMEEQIKQAKKARRYAH